MTRQERANQWIKQIEVGVLSFAFAFSLGATPNNSEEGDRPTFTSLSSFTERLREDEQEQALRDAIHRGLGLTEDVAMNAYVLLHKHIEQGLITNQELKELRDLIKAPSALVGGTLYDPDLSLLEEIKHRLDHLFLEELQDQELAMALHSLKKEYETYYQRLQAHLSDHKELASLLHPQARLSLEGEKQFYRMDPTRVNLLRFKGNEGASHPYKYHHQVFYKAHGGSKTPLAPGQEYAVYALYRLLGIEIPATLLMSVDSDEDLVKGHWPHRIIQASYAVEGESFQETLEKMTEHGEALPITNYSQQFVGALLSLPNDGKANNYIYNADTQRLTPIDNDLSLESLTTPGKKTYLNHRSILFCLPEFMDQPINYNYANFLRRLDPELLILTWLGQIRDQNEVYRHLLTLNQSLERFEDLRLWDHQESKRDYLRRFEQKKECLEHQRRYFIQEDLQELGLPLTLRWHQVKGVYERLKRVQQCVYDHQTISHRQLLEQCVPLSAALYWYIHQKKLFPLETYELLKTTDFHHVAQRKVNGQTVKQWLAIEKEAAHKEKQSRLLSIETLAEKFLNINANAQAQSLSVLEASYRYFPHLLSIRFKNELPQEYLEQLIAEGVSYSLLKKFLSIQPETVKATSNPLNRAFDSDHHEAVQALMEEGVLAFSTDQAFHYWRRLIVNPQAEALNIFEQLIPYAPELEWKINLEQMFPGVLQSEDKFIESLSVIKGVYLKHRCLSSDQIRWLFNDHGYFIPRNRTGRSSVSWWPQGNPQVYFKKRPELPGYEYAATSFMRHLGITGLPYSELMAFYNAQEGHYPVLATQAVEGGLVKDIWGDDTVFHHLDPDHTQLMILAAMLINVEDGKEDNYILSPDHTKLIAIDNDHAFMPGSIKVKDKGWIYTSTSDKLQGKSLLFCLQEMNQPLTDTVRRIIYELDLNTFLEGWLNDLVKINDHYQDFFPHAGQFFEHISPTILRIPLSSAFMDGVYYKLQTLKALISNPKITPLQILLHVEPYVGKQYAQAFEDNKNKTMKDRFLGVTEGLYKKSQSGDRLSVLNSREMMEILHISDQELIGEAAKVTTGPLAALKSLKQLQEEQRKLSEICTYLLNPSYVPSSYPSNGSITLNLKDKTWREQHQALQDALQNNTSQALAIYNSTTLSDANLQPALVQQRLSGLRCLDLRGCSSLTDQSFKSIYSAAPLVEYLNVSNWEKLKTIDGLQQPHYSLKRLVVKNCPLLVRLHLSLPELRVLEISQNPTLTTFKVESRHLKYLDIEDSPRIERSDVVSLLIDMKSLSQAEIKGRAIPWFEIGVCCIEGNGIIQNYKEALLYYKYAADQADERAQRIIHSLQSSPTALDFYHKRIDPYELRALAQGNLTKLTSLNLRGNAIRDGGASALAQGNLINLTNLELDSNGIRNEGVRALAHGNLINLKSLHLEWNHMIGNEGAVELTKGNLSNLTSLNLRHTGVREEDRSALAHGNLTTLINLHLGWSKVKFGGKGTRA